MLKKYQSTLNEFIFVFDRQNRPNLHPSHKILGHFFVVVKIRLGNLKLKLKKKSLFFAASLTLSSRVTDLVYQLVHPMKPIPKVNEIIISNPAINLPCKTPFAAAYNGNEPSGPDLNLGVLNGISSVFFAVTKNGIYCTNALYRKGGGSTYQPPE